MVRAAADGAVAEAAGSGASACRSSGTGRGRSTTSARAMSSTAGKSGYHQPSPIRPLADVAAVPADDHREVRGLVAHAVLAALREVAALHAVVRARRRGRRRTPRRSPCPRPAAAASVNRLAIAAGRQHGVGDAGCRASRACARCRPPTPRSRRRRRRARSSKSRRSRDAQPPVGIHHARPGVEARRVVARLVGRLVLHTGARRADAGDRERLQQQPVERGRQGRLAGHRHHDVAEQEVAPVVVERRLRRRAGRQRRPCSGRSASRRRAARWDGRPR